MVTLVPLIADPAPSLPPAEVTARKNRAAAYMGQMSDCMHKGRLRNDLRKTSLHLRLSFDEKAAYSNKIM